MAFDITRKRATETATIDLVDGEGSPLLDDEGNQLSVTVYGPGSKVWQQADAERNRRRVARLEKNRGKMSAGLGGAKEDDLDFLGRVTISFNGWEYPSPEGGQWAASADMFRAAYGDDSIGYIRDHVYTKVQDWAPFMRGSAKS